MIRVVVVDDSAFMRRQIIQGLEMNKNIKVVGEAKDPYDARSVISTENPDVLTLDIEMPRMDGLTFLKKLVKHHPIPVVICSTLTRDGSAVAMEALRCGAVDVIGKPVGDVGSMEFKIDIAMAVLAASTTIGRTVPARTEVRRVAASGVNGKVVCIGASTGGAVAVEEILMAMPAQCPPLIIAQHLPADFTSRYARKLDNSCAMRVREAKDGDILETGVALLAPGEKHLVLSPRRGRITVQLKQGPRVNQHRPSADLLFRSAAQNLGAAAVGVILTGMGDDGARGLLEMRLAGSTTLSQGLASCAVEGMPRAAQSAGAVEREVDLQDMAEAIVLAATGRAQRGAA
ncbi:MAG: chemotaxis response regulator protein-glutamate methylesterase [Myxococcales bacterium]|nr:chemotaxis response regulator protein-glutamate methylesterase [Myxococcales bacterium]